MYTIFFTINCVKQLTFFKTFVNQLQCEQLLIFCLKVKLLKKNFQYTHSRWVSIFEQLSLFDKLLDMCQPVVIFVLTAFFDLSQFEQLNISLLNNIHSRFKKIFFQSNAILKIFLKQNNIWRNNLPSLKERYLVKQPITNSELQHEMFTYVT